MTPVPPRYRETEKLLRSALVARSRAEGAPPPPTMADLREREAELPRPEPTARRAPLLRRGLVAAAVAVALAAGVAVALPSEPGGMSPSPSSTGDASTILRRIAAVAATSSPTAPPRSDQFVYTRRVGEGIPRGAPVDYTGPPRPSVLETWVAQDPRAAGLSIHDGERDVVNPTPPDTDLIKYGPRTYAQIAALPTDPVAMRAYLDELSDGRPFRTAEGLLFTNLVPPDVASAIYLALAGEPDLTADENVVDAAGRPGVAISHTSATGERLEFIFSRDGQFSGYRSVWTRDDFPSGPGTAQRRAGQVVGSYAVVERAVVDRAGDRPS